MGRGNETEGQTRGNEIPDLRAAESLTQPENAVLAGTWEKLNPCSLNIFVKPFVRVLVTFQVINRNQLSYKA